MLGARTAKEIGLSKEPGPDFVSIDGTVLWGIDIDDVITPEEIVQANYVEDEATIDEVPSLYDPTGCGLAPEPSLPLLSALLLPLLYWSLLRVLDPLSPVLLRNVDTDAPLLFDCVPFASVFESAGFEWVLVTVAVVPSFAFAPVIYVDDTSSEGFWEVISSLVLMLFEIVASDYDIDGTTTLSNSLSEIVSVG